LQISQLLERKPVQLSGGQRQRVAMGRALAREPQVYLFDEPLSNLDAKLRVEMRTEIKKLHQRLGTTIVYVTHDQIEAMTLADRIAVMRDGHILQLGTPDEVYNDPVDMFVAGFMGSPSMNFVHATLDATRDGYRLHIETPGEERLTLPWPADRATPAMADHHAREVILGVRPEHFSQEDERLGEQAVGTPLSARISIAEPTGADILLRLPLGAGEVTARIGPTAKLASGDRIALRLDMSRAVLFAPDSQQRLA
jgi:multiple sugar transport system ATP-binding protein